MRSFSPERESITAASSTHEDLQSFRGRSRPRRRYQSDPVRSRDAKCVLCNEVGHVFNSETGECDNPAAQFEDDSLEEIRAQLDIFQACVFDL